MKWHLFPKIGHHVFLARLKQTTKQKPAPNPAHLEILWVILAGNYFSYALGYKFCTATISRQSTKEKCISAQTSSIDLLSTQLQMHAESSPIIVAVTLSLSPSRQGNESEPI